MAANAKPETVKELAQKALQTNKEHQYALKIYTERLEAELEAVDKLLEASEIQDDEDVDAGGVVLVPGAVRATGLIPSDTENHPFAEDAERRQRYLQATVIHPMKSAELLTLADAIRAENHRIFALEAQKRGQHAFLDPVARPHDFLNNNRVGINWERVASKVSAAGTSNVQRTAEECEIRWLGDRHPELNHSQWDQSEIARVKELVGSAAEGEIDWVDIADKLGTNRTPVDCMRHAIPRKQHVWSPESDQRLVQAVDIYGTGSWLLVARYVSEDATAAQCQNRYTRSLDPNHRRGTWSEEEDEQLRRAVDVFGRVWIEVSTFVPTRSSEQCRDRWQELVNPGTGRGKWSRDEDQALLAAYQTVGEGRWTEICLLVGNGRTANMCRHRYSALMKRQAQSRSATTSATPEARSTSAHSNTPGEPLTQEQTLTIAGTPSQEERQPSEPNLPQLVEEASIPAPVLKPKPRPRRRADAAPSTAAPNAGAQPTSSATTPAFNDTHDAAQQPVEENTQTVQKRRGQSRKNVRHEGEGEQPDTGPPAKKRKVTRQMVTYSSDLTTQANMDDATSPSVSTVDSDGATRTILEQLRRGTGQQNQVQEISPSFGANPINQEDINSGTDNTEPKGAMEFVSVPASSQQAQGSSCSTNVRRRGRGRDQKNQPQTRRILRSSTLDQAPNDLEDQQEYTGPPTSQGSSALTSLSSGSP